MIKRLLIVLVLLVLVCGGLVGFNLFRSKMIKEYFAHMTLRSCAAIHKLRSIQGFDLRLYAVRLHPLFCDKHSATPARLHSSGGFYEPFLGC